MKVLLRIDEFLAKIITYFIGLLLMVIMILLFVGVIARYFFNSPIIWIDELTTYMLVTMTFLGGYIALRSDKLVRVTFVLTHLPEKVAKIIDLIGSIIVYAFLLLLGYYSIKMLNTPVALLKKTVALQMPMWIFYIEIPVMLALMLLRMTINIYNKIVQFQTGEGVR